LGSFQEKAQLLIIERTKKKSEREWKEKGRKKDKYNFVEESMVKVERNSLGGNR
jgi:hypothetical protein